MLECSLLLLVVVEVVSLYFLCNCIEIYKYAVVSLLCLVMLLNTYLFLYYCWLFILPQLIKSNWPVVC